MNCSDLPPLLDPIECREIPPRRASLGWILHLIRMMSKDMPRKKKKAYRKQELKALVTHIDKQLYARDI